MGYTDIPDSYRAIVKYKGRAYQSTATGYVTTADYTGEITRTATADTVYIAYFSATEMKPSPAEAEPSDEPTETIPSADKESGTFPIALIVSLVIIAALLTGAAAYFGYLQTLI